MSPTLQEADSRLRDADNALLYGQASVASAHHGANHRLRHSRQGRLMLTSGGGSAAATASEHSDAGAGHLRIFRRLHAAHADRADALAVLDDGHTALQHA